MSTEIKILIVEHDLADIEMLQHELKMGGIKYISQVVKNETDYCNALNHFNPDIILSDYTFPTFHGLAAFKIKEELVPDTPFIFVSGTIGEEKSIELIKNGVTDYALKEKLFTLCPKVIRALREAKEKQQIKATEQQLLLSERLLARSQQVAHMGNWEIDFSSNMVHCSAETCRIYGLSPDQHTQTQETGLSFIHAEDVAFVIEKINECRNLQADLSIHYRIVRTNGSIRHVYSEGKPEFDSNGQITGLYGIIHDITETVLLENKLVHERHMKQSEITAAVLTAQENERAVIGKELHDNLNQVLGAAKLYVELAKTDGVNRQKLLEKSTDFIVSVIEEIRRISKMLAAPGKQMGLVSSIKNLLADLLIIHPIKIEFIENGIEEKFLDEKLLLTIFRIVQEQVNNILKHSMATHATISLSSRDNEMLLIISDNGKGSDFLKEIDGVGIKNIKSRVDLYDGIVSIVSYPGKGYELKVTLPLNTHLNKKKILEVIPAL